MGSKADIAIIEARTGLDLSHTHFMSLEGCGKNDLDLNAPWIDSGEGIGRHVNFVLFEGVYYLAQKTGKAYRKPILFFNTGIHKTDA